MNRKQRRPLTFHVVARGMLRRDERGIAMPMVLAVFIVGVALISAFFVAVVGSSRVTASSKANVQAQAAAEAGIAVAQLAAASGDACSAVSGTLVGADPTYSVTASCNSAKTELKIVSTGTSASGSQQKVEAVYTVTSASTPPQIYRGFSVGKFSSGWPAITLEEGDPNLQLSVAIGTGDYDCWDGRVISGDLIVSSGFAKLGNGCQVKGDVFATDVVEVNGSNSRVEGEIRSKKSVSLQGTAEVKKDIISGGDVVVNNSYVGGSVFAFGTGQSQIGPAPAAGRYRVEGSFSTRGTLNTWGASEDLLVRGTVTRGSAVSAPISVPASPWVEYAYNEAKWVSAGYSVIDGGSCVGSTVKDTINAATKPLVIKCLSNALNWWESDLIFNLKHDIAVVNLGGWTNELRVKSADGKEHLFSMITSDANLSNKTATCTAPSTVLDLQKFTVSAPILAAVYSPCQVNFANNALLRGTLMAGLLNAWGGGTLQTFPVAVPGLNIAVDDDGNVVTDPVGGGALGALVSQRNVN